MFDQGVTEIPVAAEWSGRPFAGAAGFGEELTWIGITDALSIRRKFQAEGTDINQIVVVIVSVSVYATDFFACRTYFQGNLLDIGTACVQGEPQLISIVT